MPEFGPAMRGFVELAAAAEIADDPVEVTLLLKRLVRGAKLADLAPPARRAEAASVIAAVRSRAEDEFAARNARAGAPDVEIARAVALYERCAAVGLEDVLRELTPRATACDTVLAVVVLTAEREPAFRDDIVARDIGWSWVKSVVAAARAYREPLRGLGVRAVG